MQRIGAGGSTDNGEAPRPREYNSKQRETSQGQPTKCFYKDKRNNG